jgi:hypothetical protein
MQYVFCPPEGQRAVTVWASPALSVVYWLPREQIRTGYMQRLEVRLMFKRPGAGVHDTDLVHVCSNLSGRVIGDELMRTQHQVRIKTLRERAWRYVNSALKSFVAHLAVDELWTIQFKSSKRSGISQSKPSLRHKNIYCQYGTLVSKACNAPFS